MTAGSLELRASDPVVDMLQVAGGPEPTLQQQSPESVDEDDLLLEEVLIEDVCIDGMCGVY
jgi:mycofactocin precursor